LGPDVGPKRNGFGCGTQEKWILMPDPSFLGLERDVRPKLIIIIIIIDFTLQIKFIIFFDSNKIYFKFNNINEIKNINNITNNIKFIWPKFL